MGEGREIQEGGNICTHVVGSLHCTAEINSLVKQLYSYKKRKTLMKSQPRGTDPLKG